jgi:hypothetical protein
MNGSMDTTRAVAGVSAMAPDPAQSHMVTAIKLPVSVSNSTLTVTAPASSALAPPGDYMLFVLDGSGVPSVAKFVHVS